MVNLVWLPDPVEVYVTLKVAFDSAAAAASIPFSFDTGLAPSAVRAIFPAATTFAGWAKLLGSLERVHSATERTVVPSAATTLRPR
jgi:hypothetical protein